MPFVLRAEGDTENPMLAVPYGKQSTFGRLVYYDKGGPSGSQTKFISVLGMGEMDGVDRVYYGGNLLAEFDESGNRVWQFHPGTKSTGFADPIQGRPTFFPELDFTFSEICYIEVMLPQALSTDDQDEPSKMFFLVRGRKIQDYTVSGDNLVPSGAKIYSSNNALVAADIITSFMQLPLSRIHGPSWAAFKARCAELLPWVGGNNSVDEPAFVNITGASMTGSGGILRTLGGTGWDVAGARTGNSLPVGVDGYWEVTAGGTSSAYAMGWTNSVNVNSIEELVLGLRLTFDGSLRKVVNGVESLVGTWAPGNTFRFAIEGGNFVIYHNGVQMSSSGYPAVPATSMRGGICMHSADAGITGSTFFPASSSETPGETKMTPRYEAHVVFVGDTAAVDALGQVMLRAPGCNWQDTNGRIKFITVPTLTDVTGGSPLPAGGRALVGKLVYDPTQVIFRSNIVEKSFSAYRKSALDKPNYLRGSFRNRDSEFYDIAYSSADRRVLRTQTKSLIDPGIAAFGVGTQSLTDRILETQMRLGTDLDLYVIVKGQANTHSFAKGDIVQLSHDVPGWREVDPPLFMIIDETFEPTVGEGGSADDRTFTLQLYSPEFYSDTSHGPVSGVVVSSLNSKFIPPPVAVSLDLAEGFRVFPDETILPTIVGSVEFAPFDYRQVGSVWLKRPGDTDYTFTNITISPDSTTNLASFEIEGVSSGLHYVKIVTQSLSGISLPIGVHVEDSVVIATMEIAAPVNFVGFFDEANGDLLLEWVDGVQQITAIPEQYQLEIRNATDTTTVRSIKVVPSLNQLLQEYVIWDPAPAFPPIVSPATGFDMTLFDNGGINMSASKSTASLASAEIVGGFLVEFQLPDYSSDFPMQWMTVWPRKQMDNVTDSYPIDGAYAFLWEVKDDSGPPFYDHVQKWWAYPEGNSDYRVPALIGDRLGIYIRPDGVAEYHLNYSQSSRPVYLSPRPVNLLTTYRAGVYGPGVVEKVSWLRQGPEWKFIANAQRIDYGTITPALPGTIKARVRHLSPYLGGSHSSWTSGTFVR